MSKALKIQSRILLLILAVFLIVPPAALANKSAVEIEAPQEAVAGEEITIVLTVSHDGNSFLHYTEWVELRVNGETARRWEYSMTDRPEAETFSVTFKTIVQERLDLEAEANCNMHGSRNIAETTVAVSPQ